MYSIIYLRVRDCFLLPLTLLEILLLTASNYSTLLLFPNSSKLNI